jgi:glycosyltransferase involved in cell wall biosynthesis
MSIFKVSMLVLNPFTNDTRVLKEAQTLAVAGYQVTVWALSSSGLPTCEKTHGFTVKRWQARVANWSWRPPGLMLAEQITALAKRLAHERAEVYHAHDANALLPAFLAARSCGAKMVYDAHELWEGARANSLIAKWRLRVWQHIERFLSQRADAVITVNPPIAQELNELFNVHPLVLMNCQEYVEVPKNDVLRQELDIASDQSIVIYPGLWTYGRGLEQLLQSVPYLDENIVIVLMGPDRLNGKLQELARTLDIEDRVRFRQPVPPQEVPRYVASADLGVMPTQAIKRSYYYGSGNKLFHYLMAGLPAAVSNHPEKRRIVETYDVGAVFDETDPRSIARTINALLSDRDRYQEMCANARQAVREELNWDVEAQKLTALYAKFERDL